jgi:PAS domain S-box-containing protein
MGGFILLAMVVALSVVFAARERDTDLYAQRALITEDLLSDTLSTVRQAESGVRGYMLTGNHASLATYDLALTTLPTELNRLNGLLAQGPEAPAIERLNLLIPEKLDQLAQAVALFDGHQQAAAVDLINTDLNLGTMQDLRALIGQMRIDEQLSLRKADRQAARAGWFLQAATALAVFGTILLAWMAARSNRLQTTQLRAAEAALITANEALEQKVAERTATLHASEARIRILAESIPGIVYMTDGAGETQYVNPQAAAYSGVQAPDHMGYGWTVMVHEDDRERCLDTWLESLRTGQDYEIEYRLRRHDGVYRWFLDRAVALQNADGVITAWIGTSTDIDDRKAIEAAMANANAALEQRVAERSAELDRIFKLSTDILAVGGFDGHFFSINPAWERITGWPAQAALEKPFSEFLHPDDRELTQAAFEMVQDGKPVSVENRYRRADGSWCWLSWRAVSQPENRLIYCVARDMTAEREREEQLRQSQKMEVVGQLTGGVAHDFNNLLTIIMGSLELLQRGMTEGEPKLVRRVDAAMDAARRAAALTHRLLAFSRRQPLAPKILDVNRLLMGMSDMLHRTLGETIAIELVTAAGLWQAMADANQLENAILNLAVNARDAMPEGGHLSIETQNTYLDDSYAAAHMDVQPGQYVLVAVSDTGSGMSASVRAKVFEPFFTTKPQGQGTGLGLAQVYGFIKQSGGHVSVYSEPGEGTTVKLYLPRAGAAAEAEIPADQPAFIPAAGRGELVLVVEDEPGVRNFSAEVLGECGYTVLTAETAREALDMFERTAGIKMLFTDVVLGGGMNGRQLADAVKQRFPETIVLFTTGYTRNAIIHHGRLDEGINFIGKPFTAAALGTKVAKLLEMEAVKTS